MKKQIVGIAMLATPFVALFVAVGIHAGFFTAIVGFGSIAFIVLWIAIGSYLSSQ